MFEQKIIPDVNPYYDNLCWSKINIELIETLGDQIQEKGGTHSKQIEDLKQTITELSDTIRSFTDFSNSWRSTHIFVPPPPPCSKFVHNKGGGGKTQRYGLMYYFLLLPLLIITLSPL